MVYRFNFGASDLRFYSVGILRALERSDHIDNAKLEKSLSQIRDETHRVESVIEKVRKYAKQQTNHKELIDLSAVAAGVIFKSEQFRSEKDKISTSIESGSYIYGDQVEIEVVLINLLKNSLEAKRPAGVENKVWLKISKNSDQVIVEVSDNGSALSDSEFKALGSILKSTKHKGLGLGLAIVKSIIEQHDGKILFDRSFAGSLLTQIFFPLASSARETGSD